MDYKRESEFIAETLKRYHKYRGAFCAKGSRIINLSIILLAVSTLHQSEAWGYLAAFSASLLATINILYKPASHEKNHEQLFKRWIDFANDVHISGDSEEALTALRNKRTSLEKEALTYYKALVGACFNEVCRSKGNDPGDFLSIKRRLRWTRNLCHHENADIKTVKEEEAESGKEIS